MSRMTPSSASVRMVSSSAKNGIGVCGPDDDPGQQVAQHDRQAQLLARDGGERRGAQHQGQVLQEKMWTHRARVPCMYVPPPCP